MYYKHCLYIHYIFEFFYELFFQLLQTFLPAIVQSDFHQNIVYGMVSFLLDNCESLFQPPHNLKEEVEELCKLRNGKVRFIFNY